MGINVAAYVEKKLEDGNWELVTDKPISTRLKYIIDNYNELPRIQWDDLSSGMKEKWTKDEDGNVYATFYKTTLEEMEAATEKESRSLFTKLYVIVKALGCHPIYNEDGEEMEWFGDDNEPKLTHPISKELVENLQFGYDAIRKIGQKEAFDLIVSDHMDWGHEYRVILVAS